MRPLLVLSLTWAALACGHTQGPSTGAAGSAQPPGADATPPGRELRQSAAFRELMRSVGALDGSATSSARCLLGRTPNGYRFDADVSVALRPLPEPPEELDDTLRKSTTMRVLTRRGSLGPDAAALVLASVTDTPPTAEALGGVVTDQGTYIRDASERIAQTTSAPSDVVTALAPHLDESTVFVSAEARVSLATLYPLLEALERAGAKVALAVALAPEVSMANVKTAKIEVARCPDGLPGTDEVEGDLSNEELGRGLTLLRERAPDCVSRAEGRGAAGGRLTIAMRIDVGGKVSEACVVADQREDDALDACVLAIVHELRFAAPSPAGTVDAELPLVLKPASEPAQHAVCAGPAATQP